jgi:hypothetical protein
MSEELIINKLENQLKDKDEIIKKTEQQMLQAEYLKLKYKPYYYTLLFDKINLTTV